jgi:hypothetical protein
MKLESQVCSLELSKRLKQLGVKQESYFVWSCMAGASKWEVREDWANEDSRWISAFTVAELGEILIGLGCHNHMPQYLPSQKGWLNGCETGPLNEADSRASLACFWIEKGLVNP